LWHARLFGSFSPGINQSVVRLTLSEKGEK